MSGARYRRSETAYFDRWFLSLLRFNICTFSSLVVVTIPQPNCVGRACHLKKCAHATWRTSDAGMRPSASQLFVLKARPPNRRNHGRLLRPTSKSQTRDLRVMGPSPMSCSFSAARRWIAGFYDRHVSVSGELRWTLTGLNNV